MAVRLSGPFKVAFVSPVGMVRGTSMEGGRATTDGNVSGGRFGGLFFLASRQLGSRPIFLGSSPLAHSDSDLHPMW